MNCTQFWLGIFVLPQFWLESGGRFESGVSWHYVAALNSLLLPCCQVHTRLLLPCWHYFFLVGISPGMLYYIKVNFIIRSEMRLEKNDETSNFVFFVLKIKIVKGN